MKHEELVGKVRTLFEIGGISLTYGGKGVDLNGHKLSVEAKCFPKEWEKQLRGYKKGSNRLIVVLETPDFVDTFLQIKRNLLEKLPTRVGKFRTAYFLRLVERLVTDLRDLETAMKEVERG